MRWLEELDLERPGVEALEELRPEDLEADGDGRLVLGALRTRDEDRGGEGREGAETLEELRPEGLETDGDGRLVLGALRTRDEDRGGEGREGAETLEELRPEGLETDGDGRLVLGALRTRDEDRGGEGREGAETLEELRPEGLETDGDGRLVLGALRTRDEDRGGEGREGAETLEELRPEGLETDGDGRLVPGERCPRMLLTREELLGAKRGDGRTDRTDGAEGEDCDTDSTERGFELLEGVPRGIVPWLAVRRLNRRQRSSESDRLPPSGRAPVGRGAFTGSLTLRSRLLRPRIAAGLDGEGRLRRLAGTALDLVVPGC